MEETEGSKTVEENDIIAKSGLMENPNDKTLEEAIRVYGSGPDSNETVCFSSSVVGKFDSEFDSGRIGIRDSIREIFGEVENIGEEVQVKGVEDAPLLKISDGEGSESCASLFLEVSGPQNGFVERNEVVLEEDIGKGEYCNKGVVGENEGSSYGKVESPIVDVLAKEAEVALCEGHKFLVGDLVWVSTKTKSWWPGLIIDHSHGRNVDQNAPFLVKYFGNNPTVWCSPMQLKPFVENFERMSSQGKSRVFLSAVGKAKDEFGRRIKAQMTCSCRTEDIKDEILFVNKDAISQFEPVNFLYLVKTLAWDDSKTGVLDLIKIQSHLSPFYRSLGHHQLPVNQLHEEIEGDKHSTKRGKKSKLNYVTADKDLDVLKRDAYPLSFSEDKAIIECKSRERKKSKYLSYPYIGAINDMAVSNTDEDLSVSLPTFKRTAKKLLHKSPLIQIYQPKAPIVLEDLNTSSTDLLSMLRLAAVDCVFPIEGSGFDLMDRFFHGFKRWVFHDKYDPEMEHKMLSVENSKDELEYQILAGDELLTSNTNLVITSKRKKRKKNDEEAAKSPKKRRRSKIISPPTDLNPRFTKVHMNKESSGTALVLTFAQGFPVPSKEALVATFCGFGPLDETETKGLTDNRSAQVVFKNGLEAVEALKGIEKSSPFGPVLVKCQLRHIGLKSCEMEADKPKEAPDLAFIKKNLEMMTSTLEKGGDNLSPEMRTKLENEIQKLLQKVTMAGSTSSS